MAQTSESPGGREPRGAKENCPSPDHSAAPHAAQGLASGLNHDRPRPPDRCARCHHWRAVPPERHVPLTGGMGECRCRPPTLMTTDESLMGRWPLTLATDSCAAFRPKGGVT